jgi:hypothetical protein
MVDPEPSQFPNLASIGPRLKALEEAMEQLTSQVLWLTEYLLQDRQVRPKP